MVRKLDEFGAPIRGDRTINEEEAAVARRIFQDYVGGKSPRAIAITLNHEGVAGPSNKGWTASTIIGNRKRGTGILNNQLYIGKRIWNRLNYLRDPETRKRVSRLNSPGNWIVTDVPDLRIIDDELWLRAQDMQERRSKDTRPIPTSGPDWHQRRPKHLFSGLIKCASCGGGMTLISRVYYGCAANRNKGTCNNRLTIRLDRLEEAVLRGLQENLVTPELTEVFVREYTREINRLRAEVSAIHAQSRQRLDDIDRRVANIVDAIAAGRSGTALLDKLEALESEKAELEANKSHPAPEPVRLHPNIAEHYVTKVSDLRNYLNKENARREATQILRSLVDEIRLHTIDGKLQIELIGDLAALLSFADHGKSPIEKPGSSFDPGRTKWLVAGARKQRESLILPVRL